MGVYYQEPLKISMPYRKATLRDDWQLSCYPALPEYGTWKFDFKVYWPPTSEERYYSVHHPVGLLEEEEFLKYGNDYLDKNYGEERMNLLKAKAEAYGTAGLKWSIANRSPLLSTPLTEEMLNQAIQDMMQARPTRRSRTLYGGDAIVTAQQLAMEQQRQAALAFQRQREQQLMFGARDRVTAAQQASAPITDVNTESFRLMSETGYYISASRMVHAPLTREDIMGSSSRDTSELERFMREREQAELDDTMTPIQKMREVLRAKAVRAAAKAQRLMQSGRRGIRAGLYLTPPILAFLNFFDLVTISNWAIVSIVCWAIILIARP